MPKFRQFYLLVWKNWTLGKRSPWRTAFEVFLPLFFILILVILRVWKIKDVPEPDTLYKQFNISTLPKGLNGKQLNFAYAPNTSDVRVVMGDVIKTLGFNRSRVFGSEKEMVDYLHNEGDVASAFLGGIFFKATPNDGNIVYKIRLSSRARNSITRRKAFGGAFGAATSWNTQFTFNVFQLPGPRSIDSTHGGPPDYYGEGFLAIQNAIDMAILRYKKVPFSTDLKMQRFPYPAYIKDTFILVIQQTLPLLLMLSLTVTALYITRDLVHEKERKLKESMKMMGLSGWLHWCAWFTKFFIFLLITVILGSALFTIKFSSNGKVINKSNPILIFVFLLLYAISSIMFCFLVSVFFSKASIATAGGGIIWFFSYTPYFFVSQSYDTMSLSLKLASCLISNCNMGLGAMMIGKFEGRGTGVQWSNLYEGPSVDDDMTLGYVFLMFLADCVLYGTLTWYIEAVFPGEYGTPQPWYFPFLCSYWCGTSKQVDVDSHYIQNGAIVTGVHEKEPASLNAGVKVKRLSKSFSTDKGQKVAVDGVSINMYEGQITVLLGHNGAGKTTLMSMLTGLFPPSSGTAFVNDCNIVDDMSGVRSSLGLCPQHDVLFDRLTVEEHLWFFALLKGLPTKRVALEVDKMIQSVGLQDKRTTQTRALSGGMKRKLSVGIALIAGSKVVMLDEPTSGMDPSARRFTWDLLQQQRQDRTILLTTHFMDEADLLGDRIAIMAEGQIKCCGSSLFLKNKYGVGYHMAVVKAASCKVSMVTKVVLQYVPTAQLESNVGAELTYILPSEATGNFEDLFNELESRRDELGINSFGVSVTTMEEVFLKVGEEMDDSLSKALRNEESDNEGENEEDESYKIDVDDTNNLGAFSGSSGTHTSTQHNSRIRLTFQRWYSMFVKRLLHSRRHKLSLISQLVLPLAFTLIALINAKTFPQPEDSPPLSLNVTSFGQNTVLFATSNSSTNLVSAYKNQFIGTNTKPVRVKKSNMSYYLIHKATEMGVGDFNLHYLVAASLEQVQQSVNVIAWFNNQALHAVAITLATVQNGILKSALGFNHSLTTINHPLPRTTKDTVDDLRRNGLGFMISFNILFGMAFLASSFVVFLVQERSNKAKHVQFVSGVDPLSYWTSAYVWDLINFVLPSVSLLILLAAFDVPAYSGANLGYTFLLLMIYGWAVIPLMYLFSFLFNSAATAFVILTTFNIITGLATLMTVFILSIPELDLLDVAEVLKWVFLVLPNYCVGQGLGDIFNNYNTLYYFKKAVDLCLKEYPLISKKTCEDGIKQMEAKAGVVLEFQENYLAWANPGIGRYLVFMAWEGLLFFSIVLFIEFGLLRRFVFWLRSCSGSMRMNYTNFGELSSTSGEHDDDVFEEKRRIAVGADDQDILVIRELTKVYPGRRGHGPLLAVDNLSLGITMGECFGLLGVNGAGKTTTFRMLTGDEMMTSGTALVDSFDIRSSMGQVRQRIGYCPQFDALIGHMTVREMLYMYARLRGVPERDIQQTVNNLIRSLLLTNHADKLTKSLSGGNKRKLSTAISLVGEPPVLFLDEPTTGMDPVAKRLLWNALCRVRAEGRCIVITSHSMEECDALCTRIAIMVNGRLKCLGSPQHLKTKFGEGYTLIARVGSTDTTHLKEFVEETFPGSVLKDEHLSMVHYHITDTRVTWAQIFGAIEKVKLDYDIEDYTISQTTLDQVFLNFARGQRHEDE